MKLHRPLHVCAYAFGVFPVTARAAEQRGGRPRFRLHWPALALKAVHMTFYGLLSLVVFVGTARNVRNYRKLTKRMLANRVLDIEVLYLYQSVSGIAATFVCQTHALWPPVVRALDECFLGLCRVDHAAGAWQTFAAYSGVMLVASEVAMYVYMINYKFKDMKGAKLICLFPPLSNITCIMTEQLFYLACVSLYLRPCALHGDIKTLVRKAERPRWKCWVTPRAGGPSRLGVPAFSASDIHELRVVHRACVDLFARVNRLFQLPLLLCLFDCVFRIVVYAYGIAFDVTTVMWQKKEHIDYVNAGLWTGYCVIRIVRLWYLHLCECYVNKKILPIRLSLSYLSLILNPVTSRLLMPEIILFQQQIDTIKSKFKIFGILNVNMALFYSGFGTMLAYLMLLLQFFAFNQISMANISLSINNGTSSNGQQ